MHKNAALINRGRIGHLIGHLIGLGTAHGFYESECARGPCTYVRGNYVSTSATGIPVTRGERLPRHRMPIASRIFPIFHLLHPVPLPFIFLLRQANLPARSLRFLRCFAYL